MDKKMIELTTVREREARRLAPRRKRGPVVPVRGGDKVIYLWDGEWLPRLFDWLWRRLARRRG